MRRPRCLLWTVTVVAVAAGCGPVSVTVEPVPTPSRVVDERGNDITGLPPCPYEDGNPNGLPCVWTNPRTGKRYYVSSSEYLNCNYTVDSPQWKSDPHCQHTRGTMPKN